ncbi:MAG TPA: AGE family epimerase/isomerase [Caulobacteraceae bacterium]|jgi:mannose-1-phosphate guanylyltransferase/mannose-6-phosphate isomerase|nr:AGE family epimerase/isomerase [Caulobacteraceae bacterium]
MQIYPVILCGGSGTRLWPASRPSRPKQFIPLVGDRSLFQDTVLRLQGISGAAEPIVVAGAAHRAVIERQLADLGVGGVVLIEPEGRDSAPAIAAAAGWIAARDPEGIAVVVASDHHISDAAAFCGSVTVAAKAAALGRVVTFGVKPASASTAYGYIEAGDTLPEAPGVFALKRFVEKPDAATARAYIDAGYLWNSGNFVFAGSTLVEELSHYAPDVMQAVDAALAEAAHEGAAVRLGDSFRKAPKISIDYAVMERTDRAAVAPVDFTWSDLGAWDAVWAASPRDADGNSSLGQAMLIGSKNSMLRGAPRGPLVVGIGLNRIGIVVESDAVLVCDLAASQDVKLAVDRLKLEARSELSFAPDGGLAADRDRFERWLMASALPLWWAIGADHAQGGFHEAIDQQGRAVAVDRRARVQGRQVYVYATGAAMGWPGPWRDAITHGLDGLMSAYRRPDGLFRTLIHADRTVADDTVVIYDQAFVLLALAAAAKAAPEQRPVLTETATSLLATLRATRSHPAGGFVEAGGATPFYANPHMHLLEAALAWEEAGGGPVWRALADEIVELCLARFINAQGALLEWFDADWRPVQALAGHIVEPGHQFEWAWLLERWSRLRGRADAHVAAQRLFDVGELGVDWTRGVAVAEMLDDLATPHDPVARLWSATERLKAGLILAEAESDPKRRAGYLAAAEGAAQALFRYLDTDVPGLWRDKMGADGRFREEPAPASSLYHIICAIAELRARGPA